jgi:uncharacterized protein
METSKKYFWNLVNLLLVVLIILICFSVNAVRHYVDGLTSDRKITVSAEGKVITVPDIAKINFSVITEGQDTEKISEENTRKMNEAINFVKNKNIEDKDIQTAGYNLSPKYEYDEDKRTTFISGYTLSQTVYLQIRDFAKISEILRELPGLGINKISRITFEIENQDESLKEARGLAFEKAFIKAKEMADKNNVKIDKVITFVEYQNNYSVRLMSSDSVEFGSKESGALVSTPIIEPGSQEVIVNVSVTYAIN